MKNTIYTAFIDSLENMRAFQKLYFKTRSDDALYKSKSLEKEVDRKVETLLFYDDPIVSITADMRAAQICYFQTKNKQFLIAAKSLENKIDNILEGMKNGVQLNLF